MCRVPRRAGSVCRPRRGVSPETPCWRLGCERPGSRVREHETCIVSGLQACCGITTAPTTQHRGLLEGLAFPFSEASPHPSQCFSQAHFLSSQTPNPAHSPHLVYKASPLDGADILAANL